MKESENAKAVARDVSENIRQGKKVILGKIAKKRGYADSTTKKPKLITSTKSYQKEIKPFVNQLEKESQRLLNAIKKKKLNKLQYEAAVRSLDILTKNVQLLSGKPTENVKNILTKEQVDEIILRRSKKDSPGRKV